MQIASGGDGRHCGVTAQGRVVVVKAGEPRECVTLLDGAKRVACSRALTCAELTNGSWRCLGDIGLATQTDVGVPFEIPIADVADLASDGGHTCARTRGGDAHCWGANDLGQCGRPASENPVRTPVKVASGIEGVSVGADSTLLLRRDGTVLALGRVWFRGPGVRILQPSSGGGYHQCDGGCFAPAPVRAPFPGAVAKVFDGACAALRSGATGCLDFGLRRASPSGAGVCDSLWCGSATDPTCRIEGTVAKCGDDETKLE